MPSATPRRRVVRMTNDAYAGFLRLLLTPLGEVPAPSLELDAYLAYLNAAAPLRPALRPTLRPAKARGRAA